MYNFGNNEWDAIIDYPFACGPRLDSYVMVFIPETSVYLVIGGRCGDGVSNDVNLARITMLKDGVWSDAGQLNSGRAVSFNSLFIVYQLMI